MIVHDASFGAAALALRAVLGAGAEAVHALLSTA